MGQSCPLNKRVLSQFPAPKWRNAVAGMSFLSSPNTYNDKYIKLFKIKVNT